MFIILLLVGVFVLFLESNGFRFDKRRLKYDYAHLTYRACLVFAFSIWSNSLVRLNWICNQNEDEYSIMIKMFIATF